MKKITGLVIFLLLAAGVFASESKVQELKLKNGIPVYYMENENSKIDAVTINVEGGVFTFTPEYSGLESMVFNMMTRGSKDYSYEYLQSYFYQTGSSISSSTDKRYSNLTLVSIDDYLDSGLSLLADGFMNPTFNKSEYDKLYTETQQSVQQILSDPQSIGYYYANKVIYENHPYETSISAVPESIENLTLENIKKHHKTLLDSRRIKVFAVVNKDSNTLIEELNKTLGKIPAMNTVLPETKALPVNVKHEPLVMAHDSATGTGYIFRCFTAPSPGTKEYYAYVLANELYSTNLFNVLRNKYGMCYSPFATSFGMEANVGMEYLYRCSKFENIKEQLAEVRNITAEGKIIASTEADGSFVFKTIDDVLEAQKSSVISNTYMSQKTTAGLISRMISSIYTFGTTAEMDKVSSKIRSVTAQEIIDVFNKYIVTDNDMWCAVVGPESEVLVEEILNK